MGEFQKLKLGDICDFKAGNAFKKDLQGQHSGQLPFIKVSDMNLAGNEIFITRAANWVSEDDARKGRYTIHQPGSVVFAKIGIALTYNRRRILRCPTIVDNNMMAARPNTQRVNERYFYYLLSIIDFNDIASGSALPYLTQKDLSALDVRLPALSEQEAISTLLGAIDDKIELNRRINETLESMARALFKDWFVDFGPTRAKKEGREAYLSPEIWDLFPADLDDEAKPTGWEMGCLKNLVLLQRGFDLPKSKRTEGRFPVIAASGFNGNHCEAKVVGPGVVTGRSGVIGNVFFIHDDFWPLNTSLWVKEYPNSSPAHAYFLLQTLDFASYNSGSAVPTLNRNHVHGLPMPIPPKALIEAYDDMVAPLLEQQRANAAENDTLSKTRDVLLPKLMSGEIRLRDAEKQVEAVA